MREGIGSIFLYNIIIIFMVLIFVFLAGTMSYAKAFRVNSKIINAIEKYEGYNVAASDEIIRVLNNYGYNQKKDNKCPDRKGSEVMERLENNYSFCIYYRQTNDGYLVYGVTSYMYIELPMLDGVIKLPIYTETDRIYKFSR